MTSGGQITVAGIGFVLQKRKHKKTHQIICLHYSNTHWLYPIMQNVGWEKSKEYFHNDLLALKKKKILEKWWMKLCFV